MARIGFGEVLRRLRHDRGETLEQVSEATGLSVAMLSRVERGERLPSPDSVEILAGHFGLPVEYLMSETIANRMLNLYGQKSSSLAAERMSRPPIEYGALSPEASALAAPASEQEDLPTGARTTPEGTPRRYGPFEEMDMLAALGDVETRSLRSSRAGKPPPSGSPPAELEPSAAEDASSRMDPATGQVLRAATLSSAAAAILALREARSLPPEARLELLREVETLAGRAAEALRMLARDDPDPGVRAAASQALQRLGRH